MDLFRSEEQRRFNQYITRHLAELDGPLLIEGGTGIGKTRAYLAAIKESDKRIAIVLPSYQLIDQLLNSEDVVATGVEIVAHRRADLFDSRRDYMANREKAMNARVMACTSASVIIDQRLRGDYNGVTKRDYILFDEADQLPATAALQRDLRISQYEFSDAKVTVSDTSQAINELLDKRNLDSELRARAKLIAEAIDEPAWYHKAGLDDDGGVTLMHHLPGRLLSKIANQPNVVFVSATLQVGNTTDDFKRSLGIKRESRFSGVIEPDRHGSINLIPELESDVVDVVAKAAKPCLVATASHADAEQIGKSIAGAIVRKENKETAAEAAKRLPEQGVLVAAGVWAGLDTPIRWASIVIPRIPFEKVTVLDGKIESRYIDNRNVAVRRMRQVIGRGLRSPDASCDIYILDDRYKKIGTFVPDRFKESWLEGQVDYNLRKERKRMRAYRPKVLEKYGVICLACGLKPKLESVIHVHHLNEINEGERRTKIEDLVPLCANCHTVAHSENPPIPMDRLKKVADAMLKS